MTDTITWAVKSVISLGTIAMQFISRVAILCLAGASAVTAEAATRSSGMAERLQHVEDELAIEHLVSSEYSSALDTGDSAALADLFTPDADFHLLSPRFPPRIFKGRRDILMFGSPPPARPGPRPEGQADQPPPPSMKHFITNVRVSIDKDKAKAFSYFLEISRSDDDKITMGSTGYYEDELVRVGGRWLIARRTVHASDPPKKPRPPLPAQ